mgnify:CR=1 FL=1
MNQEFLMYRGYPLVRSGNQIYYGSMSEPYVVMMEITQQHQTEDGISVADKIRVYQIATREQNPMIPSGTACTLPLTWRVHG